MTKSKLNQTITSVSANLFDNDAYPSPPVDKPTMDEAAATWREALEGHLTLLAKYVDLACGGNLATLFHGLLRLE